MEILDIEQESINEFSEDLLRKKIGLPEELSMSEEDCKDANKHVYYERMLRKKIGLLEEPCVVIDDDKLFYVAHNKSNFAVVKDDIKNLKCYSILFENIDEKFHLKYDDGEYIYTIPEGEVDFVTRQNKNRRMKTAEKAAMTISKESTSSRCGGLDSIILDQYINGKNYAFQYFVEGLHKLEEQINYSLNNNPNRIILTQYKKGIQDIEHEMNNIYMLESNKNLYYQDKASWIFPKLHDIQELFEHFNEIGLYTSIPMDMAEMLNGTNEEYNQTKKVIDCYIKHINGR